MKRMNFDEFYKTEDPWRIKESKFEKKRAKTIAQLIKKYIMRRISDLDSYLSILDIGGGEGTLTNWIVEDLGKELRRKLLITNLDISITALKRAKSKKLYHRLIRGDCTMLPFQEDTFDLVLALEVLYYLENYKLALKEIRRVLKNNGWFIASVALGKDYLDWNKFKRDIANYFNIAESKIQRYPLWLLRRHHFGKGIIIARKGELDE